MTNLAKTGIEDGELQSFLLERGYLGIPFVQNAVGHLLLEVIVNGIAGLFILDTGASGTFVDNKHAERLQLVLQKDKASFGGAGAGGQGLEVIPSNANKLEIGTYVLDNWTVCVMSLFEHVGEALAHAGVHEELSGIIGVDILVPGKAIIDYSAEMLYLLPEKP